MTFGMTSRMTGANPAPFLLAEISRGSGGSAPGGQP